MAKNIAVYVVKKAAIARSVRRKNVVAALILICITVLPVANSEVTVRDVKEPVRNIVSCADFHSALIMATSAISVAL